MDDVNAVRAGAGPGRLGFRGASYVVALSLFLLSSTVAPRVHAFSSPPTSSKPLSLPPLLARRPTDLKLKRSRPPAFSGDARPAPVFVAFSTDEDGGEGETPVADVVAVDEDEEDGLSLPFGLDPSLLSTLGALLIFGVAGYASLNLLSSLGGALLRQLASDVATAFGNLLNLVLAAAGAALGALKFLAPYAGDAARGAADAAAPVVADAAQRAADAAAPVVAEATQRAAEAAAPVLDAAGRAVDESVVGPARRAVDAGVVVPIRGAAEVAGRAVDAAVVAPVRDAGESVGRAVGDAMPELPRLPDLPEIPEPSIKIGDFKLF